MKRGWSTKRLGDVATLQRGFDLPVQHRVSGAFPIVTSSGKSDWHHKAAVKGPGVVTGRSGSIGNVFYIEEDFWPLNTALYVKDFHGNDPRFVYHLLGHFDLSRFASGAGVPTLNRNFVHDEPVLVPPLAEQQRIVGVLDEAMAGIATARAHAETNLQNARALFESHLHAVFTQRGPGWADRKLSSICREITVGYVGPMAKEYTESGVTFLRSQNIRPFRVSLENALFISREFDTKIAKSRLRPGDVAVVRTGYPGTAAVIPESLPESNCADLVIVRPGHEIEPQYLAAFFNSAYGKEHVAGKVVGAAQKHFNVGAAKETVLHLPPLSEQRAMIAKFDALSAETQRLAALYERKLAALEELKKSLLHQAFAGEL